MTAVPVCDGMGLAPKRSRAFAEGKRVEAPTLFPSALPISRRCYALSGIRRKEMIYVLAIASGVCKRRRGSGGYAGEESGIIPVRFRVCPTRKSGIHAACYALALLLAHFWDCGMKY